MLTEITKSLSAAVERQRSATAKPREDELAEFKAQFTADLAAADAALEAYGQVSVELRSELEAWQRDLAALDPGCHRDLNRAKQLVAEALNALNNPETLRWRANRIRHMSVDTYFATICRYIDWPKDEHREIARLVAGPAAVREAAAQARQLVVKILAALEMGPVRPTSSLRTPPAPPAPPQKRAHTTLDDPA